MTSSVDTDTAFIHSLPLPLQPSVHLHLILMLIPLMCLLCRRLLAASEVVRHQKAAATDAAPPLATPVAADAQAVSEQPPHDGQPSAESARVQAAPAAPVRTTSHLMEWSLQSNIAAMLEACCKHLV